MVVFSVSGRLNWLGSGFWLRKQVPGYAADGTVAFGGQVAQEANTDEHDQEQNDHGCGAVPTVVFADHGLGAGGWLSWPRVASYRRDGVHGVFVLVFRSHGGSLACSWLARMQDRCVHLRQPFSARRPACWPTRTRPPHSAQVNVRRVFRTRAAFILQRV